MHHRKSRMKVYTRPLLVVVCLSLALTLILVYMTLSERQQGARIMGVGRSAKKVLGDFTGALDYEIGEGPQKGYIVHTSECQIPDVDMWDSTISRYVQRNVSSLRCDGGSRKPDLTYVEGETLVINSSRSSLYKDLEFCEYVEISRPDENDATYELGRKRYALKERTVITKQFIKVYCFAKNNSLVYQNLHSFTPTKHVLKHMKDSLFLRHKRHGYLEYLNVLMVGVDSVSRLNFHRQFPKTLSVLKSRLNAYEMFGYNKVRDNTFINLVPMFLGKYVEETDWSETSNTEFDKHMYSWKKFGEAGYHTLFAEDAPKIAIWNFEKPGFTHSPADYYFRPFSLAMAATKKMWHNKFNCFGDRLETDITLDYVSKFIKSRRGAAHFAFTFLTRPTYEHINQNTDTSHSRFLNSLIDEGLLENTMVIYFSDHGARRGDILSTYIGKLEERLPAMFVSLPAWFRRKYPQIAQNLELNQRRLTTPFDIYALLENVLRFNGEPKKHTSPGPRSISLFDRIPESRNCESATIADHWCTCLQREPTATDSQPVMKSAQIIVDTINNITRPQRQKCIKYKLDKIEGAQQSTPKSRLLSFKMSVNDVIGRKQYYGDEALGRIIIYHVTVKVTPGGALFHGTVRYEASSNSYHISGDVTRMNIYGDTSSCVKAHSLKRYCLCKDKL